MRAFRILILCLAACLFLNTLYYIVCTANPVLRSDAWYFMEVFVRKVFDGTLTVGDFFVKRAGVDHAQPLFKLLLLAELRFFDLDSSFESVVGVFSGAACAAILWKIIATTVRNERADSLRYLAWLAISAIIFSLKATGNWTWPLVALGYLTMIPVLLFVIATWQAWQKGRYIWLAAITLLLGVIDDDGAIIIVTVALVAMTLVFLFDPAQRRRQAWTTLAVIIGCTVVVRIGYSFGMLVGGVPTQPLSSYLHVLIGHVTSDGLQWITVPLVLSVLPPDIPDSISTSVWQGLQWLVAGLLLFGHLWFWWNALKRDYSLAKFSAICLMLLSYAWLAGILVYRVSEYGTHYLYQERYVQLYQFNLIALLLMWTSVFRFNYKQSLGRRRITMVIPLLACLALLGLQIPYTKDAWHNRVFLVAYYHGMAVRLGQLADDPTRIDACLPELAVCQDPLVTRRDLMKILTDNQLNVFSPKVQQWHPFLPKLSSDNVRARGQ